MLTHEAIVTAITRASLDAGFVIIGHRQESASALKHDEIRIVRKDRLHLEPPGDATIVMRYPDVLVTEIYIGGVPADAAGLTCSQVDLTIAYHLPYPAYLDLDDAVIVARAARAYLIEALALGPPPLWADDADDEDRLSLFDSIFSVSCTVFESGGDQQGVEIHLDHIWVFEHDQPTNEAEIEGESEAILGVIDHVWRALLPAPYEADPLAPLSYLFPDAKD